MNIAEATLEEVLSAREQRQALQQALLRSHTLPLICLTLNIAGPYKLTPMSWFAFKESVQIIRQTFGRPVEYREVQRPAGCEGYFVYNIDTHNLKQRCMEIESAAPIGRLLDIDVFTPKGQKLSRPHERLCLICGNPVTPCSRSRAHSLDVVQAEIFRLLSEFAAQRIAQNAVSALLDEARLTPKPGLVDAKNSGAHKDMSLSLLEKSACCLFPFFYKAALLGIESAFCVSALQQAGLAAEKTMYDVTSGVNTHKGAIFTLGILCAASGSFLMNRGDLFTLSSALTPPLSHIGQQSHGAQVLARYQAGGAHAEAANGFPNVQFALSLLNRKQPPLLVLLHLMSRLEDSNLLWRGGPDGLSFVQRSASALLTLPEEQLLPHLEEFDRQCIQRNLSPGGCADLLSAALFVYRLFYSIDS